MEILRFEMEVGDGKGDELGGESHVGEVAVGESRLKRKGGGLGGPVSNLRKDEHPC
jgi:hypothetical protein